MSWLDFKLIVLGVCILFLTSCSSNPEVVENESFDCGGFDYIFWFYEKPKDTGAWGDLLDSFDYCYYIEMNSNNTENITKRNDSWGFIND